MPSRNHGDRLAKLRPESGAKALEQSLKSEGAYTLGKLGHEVEAAMENLARVRARETPSSALLYEIADLVWRYFVQREMLGMPNHQPVIEHYRIPTDVLNKVGSGKRPAE